MCVCVCLQPGAFYCTRHFVCVRYGKVRERGAFIECLNMLKLTYEQDNWDKINVSHQIEFSNNFEWALNCLYQRISTFLTRIQKRSAERNEKKSLCCDAYCFWICEMWMCMFKFITFVLQFLNTIQFGAFVSNSILRYYNKLTYCVLFSVSPLIRKRDFAEDSAEGRETKPKEHWVFGYWATAIFIFK